MRGALAILFFVAGCGGSGADVTGTVAGQGFDAGAAWWGDNFIVLTEADYDCIDMSWVKPSYSDETPPGDEPKRFLQFMFNSGGEVETGVFTIAETTESPVSAGFWNYTGAALDQFRGRTGSLQIEEVTGSDKVSGTFNVQFDDGELDGTLDKIEWCTNIKSNVSG
jgi:hypothetical protein